MHFRFLGYGLEDLAHNQEIRKPGFGMSAAAKSTAYPIRALRYWWAAHTLKHLLGGKPEAVIVDMGAGEGQMRQYCTGSMPFMAPDYPFTSQRWIGLDKDMRVGDATYTKFIQCDFDEPLPLESNSVDALLCIHVMEHLPRPEFSMSEIARVLSPGGYFLGGTPVAPAPVSWLIHRRLRRNMAFGMMGANGHLNSFSPGDWKKLIANTGLELEFLSGTHLMRHSGAWVENSSVWARANLLWGGLFPSLGSELYLLAQKAIASRTVRRA